MFSFPVDPCLGTVTYPYLLVNALEELQLLCQGLGAVLGVQSQDCLVA